MIIPSLKLLLPHEHGAWGILAIPLLIGTAIAPSWLAVGVWVCAFTLFILRTAWLRWLKGQTLAHLWHGIALLSATTLIAGLPLLVEGRWLLIVVLAAAAGVGVLEAMWPAWTRRFRLLRHWVDVSVLTALAPAVIYATSGVLDRQAAAAWLVCATYFSWRTWVVKKRVAALIDQKRFQEIRRAGWREVRYSAAFAIAAIYLMRAFP